MGINKNHILVMSRYIFFFESSLNIKYFNPNILKVSSQSPIMIKRHVHIFSKFLPYYSSINNIYIALFMARWEGNTVVSLRGKPTIDEFIKIKL